MTTLKTPTTLPAAMVPNTDDLPALRERFITPPPGSGTTTLYWLNGTITQQGIREQLLALRDQCGFSGVAPLTFHSMQPATRPPYLTDEYFEIYGCILDTAKELGMSVVFYDDCDFPSGSAGGRMRELHPESLLKYLARGWVIIAGHGEAVIPMPDGVLMGVVARNLDDGTRRTITEQVTFSAASAYWAGTGIGFCQTAVESATFTHIRVTDGNGVRLYADDFRAEAALSPDWHGAEKSRFGPDGLSVTDCQPMWRSGLNLPERFTITTRITIVKGAAGLALAIRGRDDFFTWRFDAATGAIRPQRKQGGNYNDQFVELKSVPFPFNLTLPYDLRLEVDGQSVTTHIDGKAVAHHVLPDRALRAVTWKAPPGLWEVQAFVCATVPGTRFVDYLDPVAMRKFLALTYGQLRDRFPRHVGSTVKMGFYDDLTAMNAPDSLIWTATFREAFAKRFGHPADAYYPALWEDIGSDTSAARVALYTIRNELFAAGYPGEAEKWCRQNGMVASGHPAGSYNANPLESSGDALLFYKYQGVPLTDYIHYYHHGIDGFKLPASAAYNFDRPVVVCEIYGNFQQQLPNDADMLYRAGMECYVRGINFLLPHGTWWDPEKMIIPPEISWRNPEIGPGLPAYNQWVGRCESLLRGGRHVADIGMIYPIADLCANHCVGQRRPYWGYEPTAGSDYFEIMRLLTGEVRRDFTLLHPEIINERCRVDGTEFVLDNQDNWERFRILILPACGTIHLSNLEKIKAFHDAGGLVLATTCLPEKSAEFGHDAEVRKLSLAIFGPSGRGLFLAKPDERTLQRALDDLPMTWDVRIDNAPEIPRRSRDGSNPYVNQSATNSNWYEAGNRQFAYIHKVKAGVDIYYFANSSAQRITADVTVRGHHNIELWNPHSGAIMQPDCSHGQFGSQPVTRLQLGLEPLTSVFYVATAVDADGTFDAPRDSRKRRS